MGYFVENELELQCAFLLAAGLSKNCHNEINEVYKSKEVVYQRCYLESSFNDDKVKKIFTMKTEEAINKLIGILEYCKRESNYNAIERIIKFIHPSIVRYVKLSNSIVDCNKFYKKYNLVNFNEIEQYSILTTLIFWAISVYKKNINAGAIVVLEEQLINFIRTSCMEDITNPDNIKKYYNEITELYKVFDDNRDNHKEEVVGDFINNYIEKQTFKDLGYNIVDLNDMPHIPLDKYSEVRSAQFTKGTCKYIGSFSGLLKKLSFDENDILSEVKIDKHALDIIYSNVEISRRYNGLEENEIPLFTVASLYIYNLLELYKQCKDIYLNKSAEERYKDLLKIERETLENKQILEYKEEEYKKSLSSKNIEIKELKAKLKVLEKHNNIVESESKKLKEENSKLLDKEKQLNVSVEELQAALKKANETIEQYEQNANKVTFEEKCEFLNNYNIGIFGGMSTIKTLQEYINNILFYESQNQDISSIQNMDIIFINSDFISHAFTNKISSSIKKYNIPMGYISGTNIDKIIERMYSELIKR